jgi:hypothetical protein
MNQSLSGARWRVTGIPLKLSASACSGIICRCFAQPARMPPVACSW